MKRFLATLLLLSTFILPLNASKDNPYEKVWKSTIQYSIAEDQWCTAFSVNINPPTYLTATHCITENIGTINGDRVEVMRIYEEVAILKTNHALPLLLLGNRPAMGDYVTSFGYAAPFAIPFFYTGQVMRDNINPTGAIPPKHLMLTTNNSIHGMSGGPIVNIKGEVVSMVQCGGMYNQGDADFGCSSTYDSMVDVFNLAR